MSKKSIYILLLFFIGLVFWKCEDIKDEYKTEDYILYKNLIIVEDSLYYQNSNGKMNIYTGIVHQKLDFSNKYMGDIVNGKKEGWWNYWQENGDISFSHRYRNGKLSGMYCYF